MTNLCDELADLIRRNISDLPDLEVMESDHSVIEHEKVTIHNEMWKCKGLRKLHIERANTDKIEIIHCVLYPDPEYRLPIFGCDIIQTTSTITAAIVDVSPVHGVDLNSQLSVVSEKYKFKDKRPLPIWAEDIFSNHCKFARLKDQKARDDFYTVVQKYLLIFCNAVRHAKKDPHSPFVPIMKRLDDQCWYCVSQRKNQKTKAVLSQWFDPLWADKYINNVLFDKPWSKD